MPDDGSGPSYPETAEAPATTATPLAGRTAYAGGTALRPARPRARRRVLRSILFLLLPLALLAAGWWYMSGGQTMSTDDAYVEADKVGIATDVSGIVDRVEVTDNQHVAAGQVLYRLRALPYRIALDHATADLGVVRNELEAQRDAYRDMQSQILRGQADVDYYKTQLRRQHDLLTAHVASQESYETANRNLVDAQQKLASLRQQLAGLAAALSGDPDMPVERQPRYRVALAARDEAQRQLDHTVVTAPFAGIVTNVPAIAPGKYLAAAATAFFLVATDHVWVEAEPKETELTYVRPGQKAVISVDTYPDVTWSGTVESISPAAAQEFALLPAQNTSGNWVKVVQRIPMRIRVDTPAPDGAAAPGGDRRPPLRAGMSVEVEIRTGHTRAFPGFLTAPFRSGRAAP